MDHMGKASKYIMNTYRRTPLVLTRGEGSYVYDDLGNAYLDFVGGIAVCSLGHCPEVVRDAVSRQMATLIHTSNLYYTLPQIELAEKLIKLSFGEGKAFFCNSGAEANEGAIKLARKYHRQKGNDRYEIITFRNSFHGRTYGALTATAQEKFHKGFEPMLPGFRYAELNNIESVKAELSDKTAAIMIELIQGEGGVNICSPGFLGELMHICEERDILLVYDEIQTGVGRTGKFFCYEHYGIEPDIITLAKGIAGGLPIGAILARDRVAEALEPGTHATTFGGGPVICAAANAVVDTIVKPDFLKSVSDKGEAVKVLLEELRAQFPVGDVRGKGLLIGAVLNVKEPAKVVENARKNGLLINITADNVLRLVPPLTLDTREIGEFFAKLKESLKGVEQ